MSFSDSSPDPLALSIDAAPGITTSASKHNIKSPLASRSSNIRSPTKTVVLEGDDTGCNSPWRIKVTVEAQPAWRSTGRRQPKTVTVPLKDQSASSPTRRHSRLDRTVESRRPGDVQSRKPTPTRRRQSSGKALPAPAQRQTADLLEIPENATTDYSLSELETEDSHPESQHSRGNLDADHCFLPTIRSQSGPSTASSEGAGRPGNALGRNEDDAADATYAPGEATVLESEEFSMVSVDSLSSNARANDNLSPVPTPSAPLSASHRRGSSPLKIPRFAELSYMASSPPVFRQPDLITPMPSEDPPVFPKAPAQMPHSEANIPSPLRESAKKSGRALQDAVTGPYRDSVSAEYNPRQSIFAAFSDGTRRNLRESLYAGQRMAQPIFTPHLAPSGPTFASPFQSPMRVTSTESGLGISNPMVDHRLPTPEDGGDRGDAQPQTYSDSNPTGEVQYPSLSAKLEKSHLASPYLGYDDMSWVATGPDRVASARPTPVRTAPVSQLVRPSENVSTSVHDSSANGEVEHTVEDNQDDGKDIWQEEASRSIDDDAAPEKTWNDEDLFSELPVKPRRSKLPGTWRRTSGAHFNYSDSPQPEGGKKKRVDSISADSESSKASGVMTPPVTDDGKQDDVAVEESQQSAGAEESQPDDRAPSPGSEMGGSIASCDTDDTNDTGLFWQANMPVVFKRRTEQTTNKNDNPNSSFIHGSPLKNSFFGMSPEKDEQAQVSSRLGSASTSASTLARQSHVNNSRAQNSPAVRSDISTHSVLASEMPSLADDDVSAADSTYHADHSVASSPDSESDMNSSMASDARQLHNELAQSQAQALCEASTVDLTATSDESSDAHFSEMEESEELRRSYIENLNRESPMKIKVNFNDSISRSALAPTRPYQSLFGDDPDTPPHQPQTTSAGPAAPAPTAEADANGRPIRKNGFVSRLTTTFWDAVTATPPYAEPPPPKPTVLLDPAPASSPRTSSSQLSAPATSVPDHVLRLRRKYGLLPSTHPFTMAHMRTLHRLLNSVRHHPATSIVPRSGHLPAHLAPLVGSTATNDLAQAFLWTEDLVHVVAAFMSLLLPVAEISRLQAHTGTVWGDAEARRLSTRTDSLGRRGSDAVWEEEKSRVGEMVRWEWVARRVQDVCWKEEMDARRRKVAALIAAAGDGE